MPKIKKQKYIEYDYDFKAKVKKTFENKYRDILGDKYYDLIKYFLTFPKKSIRINTLKADPKNVVKSLKKKFDLTPIKWSKYSYYIKSKDSDRRDIGNTIEHQLGYIYVQESASMVPVEVLKPYLVKDGIVLDMCAAPGSKTTQLAQLKENKGLVVANELDGRRIAALGQNIQRLGATNVIITQHDASAISHWLKSKIKFDNILLDAPCSGTGTIRKSPNTLKTWNPRLCIAMAKRQRKMIDNAFQLLKKNGVMIYSTCSIEPEENEGVVDWLLKKYEDAEILDIKINIKRAKPILEYSYDSSISKTLRIWPFDNDTDGFYVALIRRRV